MLAPTLLERGERHSPQFPLYLFPLSYLLAYFPVRSPSVAHGKWCLGSHLPSLPPRKGIRSDSMSSRLCCHHATVLVPVPFAPASVDLALIPVSVALTPVPPCSLSMLILFLTQSFVLWLSVLQLHHSRCHCLVLILTLKVFMVFTEFLECSIQRLELQVF